MAAGTHIQVTNGSGPFIATGPTYTESATTVSDQKVILGLPYLPTYIASTRGVAMPSANAHLFEVMAGSALNVRIMGFTIMQWAGASAAAASMALSVLRLTSAGTGGSALTPRPLDTNDSAAGATVMSVPTGAGTEGAELWPFEIGITNALPVSMGNNSYSITFAPEGPKSLYIPAGTSNGIAVKVLQIGSNATIAYSVTFIEAPF